MRSPRPGFLLPFTAGLLLCFAGLQAFAQVFAQPKVIPTVSWPQSIHVGDFDGDGNQDLLYLQPIAGAAAGQPDTAVEIVYGDGKGNFSAPVPQGSLTSNGSLAVNVADLDGDGKTDMFYAQATTTGASASCGIWFGSSSRTLQMPGIYNLKSLACSGANSSPRITQIVGVSLNSYITNDPTIFVLDAADSSASILTYTLGQLRPVFSFRLPDGAGPAVFVDVNGDGYPDLVVLGQPTGTISVFLGNNGGDEFIVPLRFSVSGIRSFVIKDVTNDGRPDLIAEGANGHIDVFAGNGDGTFQTTSSGGTGKLDGLTGNGGHLIAIADLNHDGQPDALTATPTGISALLGQGTQYLGLKGIYNAGPGHTSYATADFNGDGNLDIAVDSPEGIAILYGNADGSFQTSSAFAAGQPAMSGATGIFTSSGYVDAVVSTAPAQAQFLRGNGDGTFSPSAAPTSSQTGPAGLWSVIQTGDFDGDGLTDIALTTDGPDAALPSGGSGLVVQMGQGQGAFAAPVSLSAAAQFSAPASTSCSPSFNHYPGTFYGTSAIGDFNKDGLGDIGSRDSEAYRIMRGNNGTIGSSSTTIPTLYWSGVDGNVTVVDCHAHAHDLVISGDLDNDGRADLIFQGFQGNSGAILEYLASANGLNPTGDLSIDGSLTTPGQVTAPAINSTFGGSSTTLGFPAFPGSAVVADLDRDGNNDLIVTYANLSANLQAPTASAPNYIYIWYGSGGGKFLTSAKHPVNPVRLTPSRNFYQVVVADMNGDGVPDLILSDGYVVSVQSGKGDGTFGAETHYLGGQGINTLSVADVNHDGKLDLVLANGGAVLTNPVANLEVLASNADVNTGGITVLLNQAVPSGLISMGTVTASPEPTTYGEAFGLTATVTSPLSGAAPTGTVAFSIDGNAIGSANLVGTTATISVVPQNVYSTLTVGKHTLTAVYSGDGNYAQSTINGTHTVSLIPTTIGLALCVDPPGSNFPCGVNFPSTPPPLISLVTMYFGQSIDGIASESENDLTGQIIFYNGSAVFCTLNANLQQGGMTCPTISGFFPVGNTLVTVDYTGDSTHAPSMSNAVQVIVSPDTTTATVTSSMNPSLLGQSVTFTANVQGNFAIATGAVTFLDGTTFKGSASLDATGHATFTTSSLTLGKHPITVAYAGNGNFNPTVSPILTQVVTAPVQGVVAASPNPAVVGNPITLSFLVTAPPASSTTIPTGSVVFSVDGVLIGTGTLLNGMASLAGPTTLAVGSHTLSAVYSGDANYLTATFTGTLTIILSPTTTTLTPTGATTIYYGQPANSNYNVLGTSATHPPTGFITVQDNGVSIPYCTAIVLFSACPYADGGANKLTLGTHSLVVLYLGDNYNAPSASAPLVFTVLPDTTTATVVSSDNPAIVGTSVTFSGKITGNFATPSGTVIFMDGAITLNTATLDANGNATFSTSTLALGTHPITLVYNSNPDFNPMTSPVLNQLITDGPTTFTLTVTPTPVTIGVGLDAVLQVTVKATGGFAEPVQLSCSGLPVEAACTFNQTLIPAGGGVTTLYFSTKAPRDCGTNDPYFTEVDGRSISGGMVLACLAMLPLYRRRKLLTRAVLMSLVTLCGLAMLSGCGHCTDLGTRPGNYTFTVTGTAQGSTALTASQVIPVTVTIP